MSHRMAALSALVLVLVLAGCARHRTVAVISDAGTVSGSVVIGYTRETVAMGKQLSGPSADPIRDLKAAVDVNVRSISAGSASAKPYSADGFTGFETTFADVPLADFAKLLRHEQDENGIGVGVKLERSGDTYTFNAEFIKKPGQINLPAEAFPGADISFALTFPGPVTDTNGTLAGNKVTWQIQLHQPPPRVYATAKAAAAAPTPASSAGSAPEPPAQSSTPAPAASSTSTDGGPPWFVWAIGGILLLVGACVVIMFSRRASR